MMDALRIQEERQGSVSLIQLKGDLHKPNALKLQEHIEALIADNQIFILLNLENVTYIDSQAILILLKINREILASGGAIKLLRPPKVVQQFLSIGKVFELFEKFETKIDAINSFQDKINAVVKRAATPEEAACENQRAMILRLMEILLEKGLIDMNEFNEEFAHSSHLVIDLMRERFENA